MAFRTMPNAQAGLWTLHSAEGDVLVPFDTFFDMTFKQEAKLPAQPVEKGGFANYNKVSSPFDVSVRLGKTGSATELAAYLEALDALVDSTDLASLVTPEKTYVDINCAGYNFTHRTEDGINRIIVELVLQEIRQVEPAYANVSLPPAKVKNPSDASTTDKGKQQTQSGKGNQSVLREKLGKRSA